MRVCWSLRRPQILYCEWHGHAGKACCFISCCALVTLQLRLVVSVSITGEDWLEVIRPVVFTCRPQVKTTQETKIKLTVKTFISNVTSLQPRKERRTSIEGRNHIQTFLLFMWTCVNCFEKHIKDVNKSFHYQNTQPHIHLLWKKIEGDYD